MKDRRTLAFLAIVGIFALGAMQAQAAGIVIYPDLVVYNAKVVTVDDVSFTSQLGTIAEAMAIKDGKILLVGSNAQIRDAAGPNTRQIDLRGRTVVPGVISTHEHPTDWDTMIPQIMLNVIPQDVIAQRWLEGTPEEQIQKFPDALEEAVQSARPGQWIRMNFMWGDGFTHDVSAFASYPNDLCEGWAGTKITKGMMDRVAPNNPVLVRGITGTRLAGICTMLNSRGIEESRKIFVDTNDPRGPQVDEPTGVAGLNYRTLDPDVVFKDQLQLWTEALRQGLSWDAGLGYTTHGTFLHAKNTIKAYKRLDKEGRMPARMAWGHGNLKVEQLPYFYTDPLLLTDLATRAGEGGDYLWYYGTGQNGSGGLSLPPIAGKQVRSSVGLSYATLSPYYKYLYSYVKEGGRVMAYHQYGDVHMDMVMDLIEKASDEAGITPDEIRAKRHTADHMNAWPRPGDQVQRLKRLGIIVGASESHIWEDTPGWVEVYGERAAEFLVPLKNVTDAGVMNTFETDRPLGTTKDFNVFDFIAWGITRKGPDGKVWAPSQRRPRELGLKSATTWGSYYVLREKQLGSLEPGKLADFLVLDRDYLTIPEEDIANIRVLLTVVGGKIIHLVPSVAREIGMQPTGAQIEFGGPGSRH